MFETCPAGPRPRRRPASRWWLGGLAVVVFTASAVLTYVDVDDVFPRLGATRDPLGFFEEHRAEFDEAAAWAETRCCVDDFKGVSLPDHLDHLSDNGKVYGGEGRVFFPQWFGIPDDAGGFWHSADGKPGPMAAFGTGCFEPERPGEGWSSCNLRLTRE